MILIENLLYETLLKIRNLWKFCHFPVINDHLLIHWHTCSSGPEQHAMGETTVDIADKQRPAVHAVPENEDKNLASHQTRHHKNIGDVHQEFQCDGSPYSVPGDFLHTRHLCHKPYNANAVI